MTFFRNTQNERFSSSGKKFTEKYTESCLARILWWAWSTKSCQARPSLFISLGLAICLLLVSQAFGKDSVPVQLKAKDGSTQVAGKLLRVSDDHYHIETSLFGILKLKISDFDCDGLICPDITQTAILQAKAKAKASATIVAISTKNEADADQPIYVSATETKTQRLLGLIAVAEATHRGYDTVQLRARIKPPGPPTQLTLAEIRTWVRNTPGQQHAIGRYQFIPKTFNSLQRRLRLPDNTRFSPAVQDQMALVLLKDAGYNDFLS